MKGGTPAVGFTIVETMIVLAITGILFVSAAVMISGRQASTQFSQGIRDVQSILQQSMNEVSSGYYPSDGTLTCTAAPAAGGVRLSRTNGGNSTQGTNKDCIFLGKTVQFAVANDNNTPTDPELFNMYTIVGLRNSQDDGTGSLAPAQPRLVARSSTETGSTDIPDDMYESKKMPYGLTVVDMYYDKDPDATGKKIGSVAFTSSLGSLGSTDVSQQVNVLAVRQTQLQRSKGMGVTQANANLGAAILNPAGGVHVCLKSGGTNQSALLSMGGEGRVLGVDVTVFNSGNCR